MDKREHLVVSNAPGSVAQARKWVADQLASTAAPVDTGARFDILLVVSELVTNAVEAGASTVGVDIELCEDDVLIQITDEQPGRPLMKAAGPSDDSGRGLVIVDALALDWGSTMLATPADGKVVWARLPVAAG